VTGKLFCGTSGFSYPSWKPDFYPENVSGARFLHYYATRLNSVEINYTYRRFASRDMFEKWVAATPDTFLFLPKAHMIITHSLKLANADEFTRTFLNSLQPLAEHRRLGPILFQLAPSFKADAAVLAGFVKIIPDNLRIAFEFRNESWFDEEIYRILRDKNAGLCLAENEKLETPRVLTADFAYLRLRKPEYSRAELAELDTRMNEYLASGRDTFAIFKHEDTPAGALHAEAILRSHGVPSTPTVRRSVPSRK
jgi:uncharacterized protein YecE (DUF72 family)